MKVRSGIPCHQCCPQEWRHTPNITGHHELDAVIHRNGNKDMAARLAYYCGAGTNESYGPRTAYNGYSGYGGDD